MGLPVAPRPHGNSFGSSSSKQILCSVRRAHFGAGAVALGEAHRRTPAQRAAALHAHRFEEALRDRRDRVAARVLQRRLRAVEVALVRKVVIRVAERAEHAAAHLNGALVRPRQRPGRFARRLARTHANRTRRGGRRWRRLVRSERRLFLEHRLRSRTSSGCSIHAEPPVAHAPTPIAPAIARSASAAHTPPSSSVIERPKLERVRDPMRFHALGHAELVERALEDPNAPHELSAANRMGPVRGVERLSRVDDARAEVRGGMLEFLVLDALATRRAKQVADHHVVEHSVDEAIDDASQGGLAAELVVKARLAHRGDCTSTRARGSPAARSRRHSPTPWHFLYFLPLPQGQGSFLPTRGSVRRTGGPLTSTPSTNTQRDPCLRKSARSRCSTLTPLIL